MQVRGVLGHCALMVICMLAVASSCQAQDTVISTTDLTQPFHTKTQQKLVVSQGAGSADPAERGGVLGFYFVDRAKKTLCDKPCEHGFFNVLDKISLVYPTKLAKSPLLVVETHQDNGGPGSMHISVLIWTYQGRTNSFEKIWTGTSYLPGNERARLITSGPLAGDIVVAINNPTNHFPWPYGIEVYRPAPSGRYIKTLNFIGKAAQAGGSARREQARGRVQGVIDIDMPEIYRRLGAPSVAKADYFNLTPWPQR